MDYGGKEVEYDLLVTAPTNMGDESIARSGFDDDLNFVPTNNATLQTTVKDTPSRSAMPPMFRPRKQAQCHSRSKTKVPFAVAVQLSDLLSVYFYTTIP